VLLTFDDAGVALLVGLEPVLDTVVDPAVQTPEEYSFFNFKLIVMSLVVDRPISSGGAI
jgi:hypothetical protein